MAYTVDKGSLSIGMKTGTRYHNIVWNKTVYMFMRISKNSAHGQKNTIYN